MPPLNNDQDLTNEILQKMTEWMERHKAVCSDPKCCEPLGVIGWLSHRLGVKLTNMPELADIIEWYERNCQGCEHHRN